MNMAETHYIDTDEEIIGTVGRLRQSQATEHVFVFPKRALILQSIINLKLLAREAEKLGKKIVIMTQDEQGAKLATKAGISIQEYQETPSPRMGLKKEIPSDTHFTIHHDIPPKIPLAKSTTPRRSDEIGSASYYSKFPETNTYTPRSIQETTSSSRTMRVRNLSPLQQTALNSKQEEKILPPTILQAPVSKNNTLPAVQAPVPQIRFSPVQTGTTKRVGREERKEKLRHLYQSRSNGQKINSSFQKIAPVPLPQKSLPPITKKPWKRWFWIGFFLILSVAIACGAFFFLRPEALVTLEPQSTDQTVHLAIVANTTPASENDISARLIREERTIRISEDTTGSTEGVAGKAHGTILISNNFSEAAQPLVTTTRFSLPDGRIYRLVHGLTVPGMKITDGKQVSGTIEAQVVADGMGVAYNATEGTLTIPGFNGSPKFDKITASIKTGFTGGGNAGTETKSISQTDLNRAQEHALSEARRIILDDLSHRLNPGETVLESTLQLSPLGNPSAPVLGSITDHFEYEAHFQIRGFIISETAIRARIDRETVTANGVTLYPKSFTLVYGAALANYETGRVDLTVESPVRFEANLDATLLHAALLGRNEVGIHSFLEEHPEIKRLQVEFKPKILVATIPNDPHRVSLEIISDKEE